MKKVVAIVLVLALTLVLFAACAAGGKDSTPADPAKAIVGSWDSEEYPDMGFLYIFNEDGTGSYVGENIRYEINGNKISIWFEGTESFDTQFEIKGDKLNIVDSLGEDVWYVRQK